MDEVQEANVQETPEAVEAEAVEVESPEASVEASTDNVEAEAETQEKMIPQSHLDKLVAREKRHAAEKARNEVYAEFEQRDVQQGVENTSEQQESSMGGMPQIPPEVMQQQIMEAAHRMSTQMTANKMAEDFESKINAEIQADPDFGDLYDKLDMTKHPEIVIWMNGMDNSAKVVKDLATNPAKFANILMLAKNGLGDLAQGELKKLSASIKTNQQAESQPKAKEPLDQLTSSSVGVDSGSMSVSDFQKQDWLRG